MSHPTNQNPGAANGTTSTLCTAYYTKITLLNNLKLTVLLLIVNVHITERATQPNLNFNRAAHVPVYEYSYALLSAHPNISDIP